MVVMSHMTILPADENVAIGIYVCVSVVTMIAALLLPIETKGRAMRVRCSAISRAPIFFSVGTECFFNSTH